MGRCRIAPIVTFSRLEKGLHLTRGTASEGSSRVPSAPMKAAAEESSREVCGMNRIVVTVATALAAGAVLVPVALAEDGTPGAREGTSRPVVTCWRTSFGGRITRVGTDAVAVRPGDSETGRPLVVRLTDGTVVRQGDVVVGVSALTAGQRARFLVRGCRSGDRKVLTALVILLAKKAETGGDRETTPPTRTVPTPVQTEPKQDSCGQGEVNAVLVAASTSSITVRTTSGEGTKEWSLAVTGDTVVRKNDQTIPLSALHAGDLVHVLLVRCASGSMRALKILVVQAAAQA
jgi:hypothetical protein